jgi:hypothetical protein
MQYISWLVGVCVAFAACERADHAGERNAGVFEAPW